MLRVIFANLTKVDASDLALKANVADLKDRVDKIDVEKINITDDLQGKDFVEGSYLYFNQKYKYFEVDNTNHINFCLGNQQGYVMKNLNHLKTKML